MITWFGRSATSWWSAAVSSIIDVMDDNDAVWEPFLIEDDAAAYETRPAY